MFALPHHPYASPYQSYNPYEQLLLQQELQRRRNAEAYLRRQLEIQELNRQHEYTRRQAELQRRRQVEMEMEHARRRERGGPARGCRHSMFDTGSQDLFDARYGSRRRSASPHVRRPTQAEHDGSQEHITPEQAHVDNSDIVPDPQISLPTNSPEPTVTSLVLPTESEVEPTEIEAHSQIDTNASHAAVSGILATFASLSSGFTFPSRLEFIPASSADPPKLAYAATNAPLHQYEHVLTGLLTHLDAVESFGDEEVRKARKEAVRQIEKELEDIDGRKLEEWKRQSATVAEPEVDGSLAEVDPSRVPLPQDGEDEHMDEAVPESPVAFLAPAPSPSDYHLAPPSRAAEPNQTSLTEASASETSDSEAEEYVDVGFMSGESTDETEEVERTGDLAAMEEWDLDF